MGVGRLRLVGSALEKMKVEARETAEIIRGMREAYGKGENAMEWCREYLRSSRQMAAGNGLFATLVAYDLQAGSYIAAARRQRDVNRRWCRQLAHLLSKALADGDSLLEVGVGEATTLAGVLAEVGDRIGPAYGFDVSWSRVAEGRGWLRENSRTANLFVGDLMNIPLADDSVDVLYSSHSLEPNRGKEVEALTECLRVARKAVLLVEPLYELASPEAQSRMRSHGYVEGLKDTSERLGATIADYRLLDYCVNPLNPSGVLYLTKSESRAGSELRPAQFWRCPITGTALEVGTEFFYGREVGLAYPVLRGIPMLRPEHVIVASKLGATTEE